MQKISRPKLSVIVAAYNSEKFLPNCLDSLIGQTLSDIEVICVDDGSDDRTSEIIKEYSKDKRIVPILNKKNLGVSYSRNRGLDVAKSDYIMFCDSDDTYDETMCEKMLNAIIDNDTDLAISEINIIYEANADMKYSDDNYYSLKFSGEQRINDDIILNTDLSPTNKIFKKSILKEKSIKFPVGLCYEDAFFCSAYLCSSKKIYYLNEQLYNYVRHSKSTMSDTWSKKSAKDNAIDHLYVAFLLFDFLRSNSLLIRYNDLFWKLFYSFELFAINNSKSQKRRREVKKEASVFIKKNKEYLDKCGKLVQSEIMRASSAGIYISVAGIKRFLIRHMPTYRLETDNIQRLRYLKTKLQEIEKIIN